MKKKNTDSISLLSEDTFVSRHIGLREENIAEMTRALGASSLKEFIESVVPPKIRSNQELDLPNARTEEAVLSELKQTAKLNQVFKSLLGMGYHDCFTPGVIQRNILESPAWYTPYTPYQAEVAQGRLEALINFQTLVLELTGFSIANASLLDEGTAAAEAMNFCFGAVGRSSSKKFFASHQCHPHVLAVLQTRAKAMGIELEIGDAEKVDFSGKTYFGILLSYPQTDGKLIPWKQTIEQAHANETLVVMATDLLALTLITPPAELGADVAIGTSQRFGVPLGFGGPHAAFFATHEKFKRQLPGRIVGVSKDAQGKDSYRLALQTREQHIRRDRATSNICTAQALLAVVASMYAVYHGPHGLKKIALRVHRLTHLLKEGLTMLGCKIQSEHFFDTLCVEMDSGACDVAMNQARVKRYNLRRLGPKLLGLSWDETLNEEDVSELFEIFSHAKGKKLDFAVSDLWSKVPETMEASFERKSTYLQQKVFNEHRSETEMLRYIYRLQARDLSLAHSMIPLGSCTMKLNATSEMIPISWPQFSRIHPFAPKEQVKGYLEVFRRLENDLKEITGFEGISLQPNAGSQGEFAGLLAIRNYHQNNGGENRTVCLIPRSAHGTNPASAAMAGLSVVVVECSKEGNIDLEDLKAKLEKHGSELAALMVTYPSTYGVFEESIKEVCSLVHAYGGQVYLDGANMNAQIGICRPADLGADVCHLNLHKTFCIPHGGGGPGMGPIGVAKHLVPYLPSHPYLQSEETKAEVGPVSSAPWGSASILPISWMYLTMMGGAGLTLATQVAILNANYITKRLESYYPLKYSGRNGRVAHECIFDLSCFKEKSGIEVEDVAKRLIDYGFHAPTMSWPDVGTLMIEPTESESQEELDRFCDAMIEIRKEIQEIEEGKADRKNNVLKNAPHTVAMMSQTNWDFPYSREKAAYPLEWVRDHKFWPSVARVDNVHGDRNLVCACS